MAMWLALVVVVAVVVRCVATRPSFPSRSRPILDDVVAVLSLAPFTLHSGFFTLSDRTGMTALTGIDAGILGAADRL